MKVIQRDGFKLPFVGKDKFVELMRSGVGYNRDTRTFYIRSSAELERVKLVLSKILNDDVKIIPEEVEEKPVTLEQTCFLCGKNFPCKTCEFFDECPTKEISSFCVCPECQKKSDGYEQYIAKSKVRISAA